MNPVESVREATPDECAMIAAKDIVRALEVLDSDMPPTPEADHIRMYLRSALVWLRGA